MSGPDLIQGYLAELGARLPASVVAELADGLSETFHAHLRLGMDAEDAARSTVAEFGDPASVIAAFSSENPPGTAARSLLLSGPLVGSIWAAVLVTRHAWEWPIAVEARVGFAAAVLSAVALLAAAALATRYRRAVRRAAAAYVIVLVLDASMLGYVATVGLLTIWPVPFAAAVSVARIGFGLRRLPRLVACC